ncbi:MAG TPA: NIL domain-containing protein [Candidatus Omnitrophota bacterium]|nr:NIL domain-containing protein [Candidatus Omnitrophota bacterium]
MKIRAELTFPGKLKDDPILCNLCKEFLVTMSILEASFSTDTGWALVILEGNKEELNKTLNFLKTTGVEIQSSQELH